MDRQKNRAEQPQSSEDKKEDDEKKKKIKRSTLREPRDLEHPHSIRLDPWFPGLGHPDLEVLSLGLGVASTGSGGDGGSSSPAGDGGDGRLHLADGAGRRLGSRPAVRRRYRTGARHADLERIEGRRRLEGNLAAHRVALKSGRKKGTGEQHGGEGEQSQGSSSSQKQQSVSETQREREKHDLPPMYLDIDDLIITRTSDGEDSDELCSIKSDSPRDATPPRKIPPAGRRS
uniref:Uncharacterized protein n=1 Tax=Oryza sativa subsp. japonica TaxID=39947 RepID=Q6K2Z5_ORYSJ|nr:hypothetical protein [Oryza sativa Japonica Group]